MKGFLSPLGLTDIRYVPSCGIASRVISRTFAERRLLSLEFQLKKENRRLIVR
jgi:hypothetical protein